jgi:predicted nucleotidyltransferase
VRSAGIPVEKVYIFGSQAKGTARPDSDIDIAIVSPIFGKDVFDERLKLMHLRKKDYDIEPHPLHPNDLNRKWSTFIHEVKKYGIPV